MLNVCCLSVQFHTLGQCEIDAHINMRPFRSDRAESNSYAANCVPLAMAMAGLSGCIFLPATTSEYDPGCDIIQRHVVLRGHQIEAFYGCQNDACIALLALAGAVTASSVVISGSVAVVGDMVYWLEAKGQCAAKKISPK
jgi:hypothetical protein